MARTRIKYGCAALIVLLLVALWLATGFLRPSVGYTMCAEFASLPADDQALEQWLRKQPHVHTVHAKRDGRTLEVFYIINRNRFQKLPDVQAQCAVLGYSGQVAPFRDCGR
jgi:hypothetical protein